MGQYNSPPDLLAMLQDMKRRLGALEVGSPRLYSEVDTAQSTSSTTPVDLGGPSVTLSVPANAFVCVYAQFDILNAGAVMLAATPDFPANIIGDAAVPSYQTVVTTPGNGAGTSVPLGGPLVFAASAGVQTYKLLYVFANALGATPPTFRNRKLWVWTLG